MTVTKLNTVRHTEIYASEKTDLYLDWSNPVASKSDSLMKNLSLFIPESVTIVYLSLR